MSDPKEEPEKIDLGEVLAEGSVDEIDDDDVDEDELEEHFDDAVDEACEAAANVFASYYEIDPSDLADKQTDISDYMRQVFDEICLVEKDPPSIPPLLPVTPEEMLFLQQMLDFHSDDVYETEPPFDVGIYNGLVAKIKQRIEVP